ncbi:hypothetical protein AWC38_SpisGene23687 [Stylophora pistillata]|uniref:Uncharacterized protein n=1 Tax=Stylophora pistillata TaxID=50429 RepID=A0A2B4R1Z7_STYPI|nr:hypothetical protein AWC38_SpisGene23687 [Stylophora pistillata]
MCAWSERTLARRLQYFDIKFTNYEVDIEDVKEAVRRKMDGPGQLLGYRSLQQKVREIHGLNVPRDVVYAVMKEVSRKGFKQEEGADCTRSLDGHDKLCGYQKAMSPLCIYGAQDTYSARINFLRIWTSNNNSKIIGKLYLDYLYECRVLPLTIRIDRGSETGIMATMHTFLRAQYDQDNPVDSVLYGPSTQNKLEGWWRELLDRMERFFKSQLSLVENGDYGSSVQTDRALLHALEVLGVHEAIVRWVVAFLIGRIKRVRINGQLSSAISPRAGIPQGTHLAPLLFTILVNSLASERCTRLKYVDDLTILELIPRNSNSCLPIIASNVNRISSKKTGQEIIKSTRSRNLQEFLCGVNFY